MGACTTTMIVIATILGPITLVFMSVSFGTNFWVQFTVNVASFNKTIRDRTRTDVGFARYHLTRDRGLFRECYPGNETEFLDKATGVVDDYCFNINYDQPSNVQNPSDSYMTRLHLNRSFLAFFVVSIALFVIAYIFGLILCCLRAARWAYVAGIVSYSSAFFLAAAIAFFHGAEYIERNKLNGGPNSNEAQFYPSWEQYLKDATTRQYGWSYPLAWVGMILATIAATFYSLAGCYIASEFYEDEEVLHKSRHRNYPGPVDPVYAIGADPYYTKHYGYPRAFLGPLAPDYYARTYPAIGYGDPRNDIWHWREVES
ncbi:unnamed protein product [Candidula unifasciata]|uniref:Uncharacterized protein n=1 Tax=Candidula unifasciata TaxID=100452 RepID=A0A8S3ZJ19_9EUPU|nr:unnamed protein product [Candidula unifasciata]